MFLFLLYVICLTFRLAVAEVEADPTTYEFVSSANPWGASWFIASGNNTEELTPVPIRKLRSCSRMMLGRLIYAATPKSNSRQMRKMLCELMLRKQGEVITEETASRLTDGSHWCMAPNTAAKMATQQDLDNPKNHRMFVWRDPVERFVSMYGHVCITHKKCGTSGESVHTASKAFYEFLKFGLKPDGAEGLGWVAHHVAPTTWSCGIGATPAKVHPVVYNKDPEILIKRLRKPLRKTETPHEWVEAALDRLRTTTTNKLRLEPDGPMKYENWISEVKSNRTTMAYVLATYYHDYRLWKMPIPSIDGI